MPLIFIQVALAIAGLTIFAGLYFGAGQGGQEADSCHRDSYCGRFCHKSSVLTDPVRGSLTRLPYLPFRHRAQRSSWRRQPMAVATLSPHPTARASKHRALRLLAGSPAWPSGGWVRRSRSVRSSRTRTRGAGRGLGVAGASRRFRSLQREKRHRQCVSTVIFSQNLDGEHYECHREVLSPDGRHLLPCV
jgi:hypothetical protein